MIEVGSLPPVVTALVLVGLIVVQAVGLYIGYGVIERIAVRLLTEHRSDA